MSKKYILTQMYNQNIAATFSNDRCTAIDVFNDEDITGNIYVGRVENIVPDINSAFIEISKGVKCYYSLNDNKKHRFINPKNNDKLNINDHILVQVLRGPIKTKPATVTSDIALTGKYVVLNTDVSGISISSKIKNKKAIFLLEEKLKQLIVNEQFGFIIRTNVSNLINGENISDESINEVLEEAKQMSEKFNKIIDRAKYSKCFNLIYKSQPAYIKFLRSINISDDYEVITDDSQIYESIDTYLGKSLNVRFYCDDMLSLSKLYSLEREFEHALSKKVWLKCGGYIVIEQTEALTVIDVNSGKCVSKKSNKELKDQTVLKVNLEAAQEIAYQMRLRNLSGIIIVDFINMKDKENNKELMKKFSLYLKEDSLKTRVEDITKLGLVEVTRQKSGKTLFENIGADYLNAKK